MKDAFEHLGRDYVRKRRRGGNVPFYNTDKQDYVPRDTPDAILSSDEALKKVKAKIEKDGSIKTF